MRRTFVQAEALDFLPTYLNELKYMAADKNASQMRQFQNVLIQDGKRLTRSEFLELATPIDNRYNVDYLATEYNTTVAQATRIRDWNDFDKPLLRYRTVNDANVRHEHQAMNGVTLPKDDPFWETYAPLNGWNCRCYLQELDRAKISDTDDLDFEEIDTQVPKEFRNNPAVSGTLWKGGNVYRSEITEKQKQSVEKLVNG